MEDVIQLHGGFAGFDDGSNGGQRKAEGGKFLLGFFRRGAFDLVDDLEELVFVGGGTTALLVKVLPGVAAAQPDDEVLGGEAEGAQRVDQQGNELGIGGGIRLADEVGIKLEVFAQPAFLLTFVAKKLGDGEPFDGLLVVAFVGGNHAGERGGHLGTQGNFAFAFIGEIVELSDDFFATLGGEEFERFERGAVVFAKAIALGDLAPGVKDVLAGVAAPHIVVGERFRIKITESGQSFHRLMIAGGED